MKNVNLLAIVLTLCLSISFASAGIAPLGDGPITLADLEELHGNVLPVGDKIFSDFQLVGSAVGGALTPTKDSIQVQGVIQDDLNIGLRFILSSFSAAANQSADIQLSFKVEIQPEFTDFYIKDVEMTLTGAAATGTGLVIANEFVSTLPVTDPDFETSIIANLDTSRQDNLDLNQLTDSDVFDPVKAIYVRKDIQVNGGTGGAASLSEVFQIYSQIPEPATLSLLGLGSLTLLARRRRRS